MRIPRGYVRSRYLRAIRTWLEGGFGRRRTEIALGSRLGNPLISGQQRPPPHAYPFMATLSVSHQHSRRSRFGPLRSGIGYVARGVAPKLCLAWLCVCTISGCGTTKSFDATEQLLLSDAVDSSISAIDFRPLGGFKVYLDTQYIKNVKGNSFVNADYVISSLRQQVLGAGCLLQDKIDEADIVIEARVGTLGSDAFQVTYGMPRNAALSTAAAAIPTLPALPVLPDLSIARRESMEGAAKIAAFAYDRETRQPVWQSGIARSATTARDTWIMGVGPIQTGTVRHGTRVVGAGLEFGAAPVEGSSPRTLYDRPPVNYGAEVRFDEGTPVMGPSLENEKLLQGGQSVAENSAATPGSTTTNPGDTAAATSAESGVAQTTPGQSGEVQEPAPAPAAASTPAAQVAEKPPG